MSMYLRPQIREEIKQPPPGSNIRTWYHVINPRYVTKPMLSQVTPTGSIIGSSKIVFMGPEGTNTGACNADVNGRFTACARDLMGSGLNSQVLFKTERLLSDARNKAYDRFVSRLKGTASDMGVNLAEGHQAIGMVVERATTLRRAYLALRKGNFRGMLDQLNVRPLPKHKRWRHARHGSALWLEYHFGWSPLIQDIHDACDVLQTSPSGTRDIRASGTARADVSGYSSAVGYTGPTSAHGQITVKYGSKVEINNQNLFLANRLGLVNPASIAWELVPFSFLVDWFIPVGNFLNSYTDFLGVSFKEPYTTHFCKVSGGYVTSQGSKSAVYSDCYAVNFTRSRSKPSAPVVYPKTIKGLSVSRAATAVSLLIQVFQPGG